MERKTGLPSFLAFEGGVAPRVPIDRVVRVL